MIALPLFQWNNASALQILQLFRVSASILTGVVLAKSGLPTLEIGTYETLLFIGATASFFWVNGLLQGIAPVYASQQEDQKKHLIFAAFGIFCAISLALCALLTLFSAQIIPLLSGRPDIPYYNLFCLYLLFNLPSYPVEYYYLVWNKPKSIVVWGLVGFLGHLISIGLPLFFGYSLEASFYCLVFFAAFKCCWAAMLASSKQAWILNMDIILRYLKFSWPLVLSALVSSFMVLWDNWLVSHGTEDMAQFAIYRYGARELPLALPLCTALGSAMIVPLMKNQSSGRLELKNRAVHLMHLLFPLSILLLFSSAWIYPRIFNPDFAQAAPVFNVFLLTIASRVLLPGSVLLSLNDSAFFFRVSLLELVFRIVLTLLLMQMWDIIGIAWGVVLSFWVEKIALVWRLKVKHSIAIQDWLDLRWYAFYVTALAGAYFLSL